MLIHSKICYYLIFYISKIDQLQFIRMFQKIKSFSFIYIEFINIILNFIFLSNSKSSLMHNEHYNKSTNVCFYINDIFDDHVNIKKSMIF